LSLWIVVSGHSEGARHRLEVIDDSVRSMISWLIKTIRLKGFTPDKWKEHHDEIAAQFLTALDARKLVAFMTADGELGLIAAHSAFPVAPKQFCFWVRRDSSTPSPATVKTAIQFGMVNGGGVDSLVRVMGDVFTPIVASGSDLGLAR